MINNDGRWEHFRKFPKNGYEILFFAEPKKLINNDKTKLYSLPTMNSYFCQCDCFFFVFIFL